MRNKTRLFGTYLPFFILLLLGAVTLRTVTLISYFNYDYHYFTAAVLPKIADGLIVFTAFFFIIYIIGSRKRLTLIPNFSSPANYVPSAALSASLIFAAIYFIRTFIDSSSQIIRFLSLALAVLAFLSIAYLFLNTAFIRTVSIRRATFGLSIILFLSVYLTYLYFDGSAPISSPVKTVDQLTYAFSAVFFLYEIRLSLGREKWKAYILFGFIAALLAAYSAFPAIIVYFVNGAVVSNSIYESILTFSIFIFISSKLILVDSLTDAKESQFITKLKESAAKREEELNPKAKVTEKNEEIAEELDIPDENQISILEINSADDSATSLDTISEEIITYSEDSKE